MGNDVAVVAAVISPQVAAALVAGIVAIITSIATATVTVLSIDRRGKIDERLASMKAGFDRELAEQRARLDNRATYAAERVAHELLMHPAWEQRSFAAIEAKLGGFSAAELRKILVQAGAVQFEGANGGELWGLIDRNRDKLA